MNLAEARVLRDEVRKRLPKCRATAPRGVDGYFVRIVSGDHRGVVFSSRDAWDVWCEQQYAKFDQFCRDHGIGQKPRSPIEMMIYKACGRTP